MSETIWHPSQQIEKQASGSVVLVLEVTDSYEFTSWVLWWGNRAEVLEPAVLRERIVVIAQDMADIYSG